MEYSRNLAKLKKKLKRGQIVPCEVYKVLNDRDVLVRVHGLVIKAYTNLSLHDGDKIFMRIDQIEDQLRFKLLSDSEYNELARQDRIDYTI